MAETAALERRGTHARIYSKLGPKALETCRVMLDALEAELADTPWNKVTPSSLVRTARRGQAAFYQYFPDITAAFDALMARRAEQGLEPTEHMRLIADLLAHERKAAGRG